MLSATDKKEIQGMLDNVTSHLAQVRQLEMQIIDGKLDSIIEQTTKTNGTVRKHTEQLGVLEKLFPHSQESCPNKKVIQELRDDFVVQNGLKKWKAAFLVAMGVISGAIVSFLTIYQMMK